MTRHRYTVYDTSRREYLRCVELSTGDERGMVTHWTKLPEAAMRFPGVKTAAKMVVRLGSYSEFVVKNEKGEIVG